MSVLPEADLVTSSYIVYQNPQSVNYPWHLSLVYSLHAGWFSQTTVSLHHILRKKITPP